MEAEHTNVHPLPDQQLITRSFPPDDAAYNEYTIENGIDRPAVGESVFDKTSVAGPSAGLWGEWMLVFQRM
jgi:hypothetical protein